MKITAFYLNGRVEEYNTETHYSSSTLFGSNNVGVVNYCLDLEDIDDGLWIQFRYYDGGESLILPVTGKSGYGAQLVEKLYYPILTKDDLKRVAYVECDGTRILWRPEPDAPLINGVKFAIQSELLCSGKDNSSLEQRAVDLYRMYRGIDGESGLEIEGTARLPRRFNESSEDWDRRIAELIGWDYETLMRFVQLHKDDPSKNGQDSDDSDLPTEVDPYSVVNASDILPPDLDFDEGDDFEEDDFDDDFDNDFDGDDLV